MLTYQPRSRFLQTLAIGEGVGFHSSGSSYTTHSLHALHGPLFSMETRFVFRLLWLVTGRAGGHFGRLHSAEGARNFFLAFYFVPTGFLCVCVLHITKCHAGRLQTLKELGGI